MLKPVFVVARKEAVDSLRDTRSVISSLMYALMGPAVIFMVSMAVHADAVLIGMMSVFTLVAAFVGGMNVAMDTIAGERERQSLLPLLMNPVRRREIVLGKWLAVGLFSMAGLILNLAGFAIVFARAGIHLPWLAVTAGILPLALLAASLQLLISNWCAARRRKRRRTSRCWFSCPWGWGCFRCFFRWRRARMVRVSAGFGATVAARTLAEEWRAFVRPGCRAGLRHGSRRPSGIGVRREPVAS